MSVVSPPRAPVRRYARVVRQLVATRGLEVCVLQASPLLGAVLGGLRLDAHSAVRVALLLLGSTALTAHVFVFNDWAGYRSDALDLRRAPNGDAIDRDQLAHVAVALLVLANVALAADGTQAILFGAGIAALSLLYSFSPSLGKGTPVAASLNHVVGGVLHFLLGYSLVRTVDTRGVALSLFFGLVFAAGHLNHEVRDHDADLINGIGTSAVVFGSRRTFAASYALFTAAYLLIVGLAVLGDAPRLLVLAAGAWLVQSRWSLQAFRLGLGFEAAAWMQRRYRLLLAAVGLAMLVH